MLSDKITNMITPHMNYLGYEVVCVRAPKVNTRYKVEVLLERTDGTKLTLGDCQKASTRISVILDVEDPINTPYTLEVSSPGIDRPLVKPADYKKYKGYKVHLHTVVPVEERRKFVGMLGDTDEDGPTINVVNQLTNEEEPIKFSFENIKSCKLDLDFVIKKEKLL